VTSQLPADRNHGHGTVSVVRREAWSATVSGWLEAGVRAVETVLFLVVLATVMATFARRIRVPAPPLLVVAGVAVALIPGTPDIQVAPGVVSLVILPPLLYAAGEELSWRELRFVWRPVTVLSVGLVVTSAAAVGAVTVWTTAMPASLAFVLGAVLASTDPVAVSALGRRLALPPRLQTLVQGESLFNDATSLILFRVSLSFAVVGAVSWGHVAAEFGLLAFGGAAVGAVVAAGVVLIRSRTEDPVLESVIALVTPYLAYVLAEQLHGSGVTAVVVASVTIGALRPRLTTPRIRLQLAAVYPTVIFLLESVVFSLIGLALPSLVRRLEVAHEPWLAAALAISATLLLVRIAWVLPIAALAARRNRRAHPTADAGALPGVWPVTAVVAWAGARGVVPLAAALSIPLAADSGRALAGRDLILVLAIASIAISLVVQGFTLSTVVSRSGIALPAAQAERAARVARERVDGYALAYLDELADREAVAPALVARVRDQLRARIESRRRPADGSADPAGYRQLWRDLVAAQSAELARLYATHEISDAAFLHVQRQLDLEHARLADDG
jgi:monovalent cation/hydrogen antiporter